MRFAEAAKIAPILADLELDFDKLVEVVRSADRERALCNANDPKGFDLIVMNAKVARGLRDQFCGERWERDETDNQPGIRNSFLKKRIIPCNFDMQAGQIDGPDPTNLTEKGSASKKKVRCNLTPWIPGLPDPSDGETDDENGYVTYVLGSYWSADHGLRAELSRPKAFASGRYTRFETRIILLNGSENPAGDFKTDRVPTEVVDIAIKRK